MRNLMQHNTKPYIKLKLCKLMLTLLAGILIGILSVFLTTTDTSLIFLLGLLTILFTLFLAFFRMKYFGLVDALAIFSLFFASYNGILLLQVAMNIQSNYVVNMPYPINFSTIIYEKAGIASFLAAFGLLLGGLLSLTITIGNNAYDKPKDNSYSNIFFYAGLLTFSLGILLLFINYQRIGGFSYALSLSRGVRMDLLSQTRGNLPYESFAFSGLALMYYSYFTQKNCVKYVPHVAIFIWFILMFTQGDRRFIIYSLMIILGIAESFYRKQIKLNMRFLFTIFSIYILFAFIANVRWIFPFLLRDQMSLKDAMNWIVEHISFEWILPAKNEFAGPYFTLLYSLKYPQEKMYGISYLSSLIHWLPRSLYPGEKPLTIAQGFALQIYKQFTPGRESVIGWGYSPVAEAFNNFGSLGVLFIFLILGFMLGHLEKIRRKGSAGLVIYAIFLPEVINLNRINFSSVVGELVFNIGALVAVLILCNMLCIPHKRRCEGS
jgi:oligosaccharide repeat unit polymerase